jgi:hypothetical protein
MAPYENPDHSRHNLQVGDGFVTLMALGVPTIFKVMRYSDGQDGLAKWRPSAEMIIVRLLYLGKVQRKRHGAAGAARMT